MNEIAPFYSAAIHDVCRRGNLDGKCLPPGLPVFGALLIHAITPKTGLNRQSPSA
jgi:hypothetical protein